MAKHVGFFLLVCFVLSVIADDSSPPDVPLIRQYGGGNSKQRRELDFADIAKHLESVTSASTSIGDIKEAVLPFLNWRKKRSSDSGFNFAVTESKPLKVRVLTTKKPPSSIPHANLRRKRSNLDKYLEKLKEVLAVPKAAGKLVKKVKTLMEKARNISEVLCKNCPKGQRDQVDDDDYDDYYYDDDDYFYRKRRNVEAEVPQRPKRAVKDFIDLAKTINGQVVGQAKNLLDASLDATGKAVKAAFGMVSGALNREKRSSSFSIIDTASRMLDRVKRAHPTFLQEAQAKLTEILKDSALVADKLYTTGTIRLKAFLVNLLEFFYSTSQSFINATLSRKRRSVDNGIAAEEITALERSKRFAKTMLEQKMNEVKKVVLDVLGKVKAQVLMALDQIAGVVKAFKSKLQRRRRSINSVKSVWKREGENELPSEEQLEDSKSSTSSTTTSQSPPETAQSGKGKSSTNPPETTSKDPIVKNIDNLTTITDTVSDMLDLIADLTDMFAIARRKRDNGIEVTELETPIKDFIKDMENGALRVLSKTKKLIGHTIEEVGHSIDLGLQMVSTALSRRRRSADDEDQISIGNEIEYALFDIPEVVVGQLSEATDDLKKWFDDVIIANGKLSNVDVTELIPNVNQELDLLYRFIMDYLASSSSSEAFNEGEDGYEVENAYSTGLIRKKRFLTLNAIAGMLLTKVAAKVTEWVYGAVKNSTVELMNNIKNFEENVTSSNRTKRETEKSLLDGIIEFPGKMLENMLRKGKNSADAIIKVITGKKTLEFENEYPGRR